MFSNEMDLKNPTEADAIFDIEREERSGQAIRSVRVDDAPAVFERSGNSLTLRLIIPAQQTRKLRVVYQNDLDLPRVDISKGGLYVWALRLTSDVRDLYLSRSVWGHKLTKLYYRHGWDATEPNLERSWPVLLLFAGLAFYGIWYYRRKIGMRPVAGNASRSQGELGARKGDTSL
jgi:hypothetical protein